MPAASANGGFGPVGRLVRWLGGGQSHEPDDLWPSGVTREGRLLSPQPIDPGEVFLLSARTQVLAARRNQHDLGPSASRRRGRRR